MRKWLQNAYPYIFEFAIGLFFAYIENKEFLPESILFLTLIILFLVGLYSYVCNATRKKNHIKTQTWLINKSDKAEAKLKEPNIDKITAESLQADLNHYRARVSCFSKQIIKETKACNTSIGGLLIIAITMGIFFHNNIYNTVTTVSQAIVSINNFLSDDILVDSDTFETEPVSEKSNIDSDPSEESEQQHSADNNDAAENNSMKIYNSECLMNLSTALDIPELSSEKYNDVYFGLSEEYLSENAAESEDDENGIPYADFSGQLTALIYSERTNCLVYADESYQNKVITTTNDCFDFLDYLDYVYNNPPAYKGTQLWYELLPDAVNLLSFINDQEIFFSQYPDKDLAQELYIDYWHLGNEFLLQYPDSDMGIRCYSNAAYYLLQELSFADQTSDDFARILNCLKLVYEKIFSFTELAETNPEVSIAGYLAQSVEHYLEDNGYTSTDIALFGY